MKSLALIILITLASSVQAAQILHCKGGIGGPPKAEATLVLNALQNNIYSVDMKFSNSVLTGIKGKFEGQLYPDTQTLIANGKIRDVDANILLSPSTNGSFRLDMHTLNEGDRDIEFGFGVHITCKE